MEEEEELFVTLTDLEKCYDTIWRDGLIALLYTYGVGHEMLNNIATWIEGTVAIPEWNGVTGERVTPREGLKQGCVLSPILCIAFMNAFVAKEPQGRC